MDYAAVMRELEKYPPRMTALERQAAYAKGEEVDHIPFKLISSDTAANLYGYTYGECRRDVRAQRDVMEKLAEEFGSGAVGGGLGLKCVGEALGSKLRYPENGLEYIEEHLARDYAALDSLEVPDPRENEFLRAKLERMRYLKNAFPKFGVGTTVAGPLTTAASLRSPDLILRDMRRRPEELHRLLAFCVDTSLAWMDAVVQEFGPLGCNIADPVTSVSVVSKQQFEEFTMPHLRDLVEGIKARTGFMPSLHICGKTKPIWEHLVTLGFLSFSVDNCEDLAEVKAKVGDRMSISGNVPPVDVLRNGTIDEVIDSVRICLQKASDSPMGYMLAAGCQVPLGTPRENLYAYIYAARKYGRGARRGKPCKGLEDASAL
ncbi:MAG: uroporphyrinogen decarboxylase family protein [Peptococcaceae bacterium]|jgi:uroporphyrinogen decarboxylase|nr:uroporphyrinogen decarboxylase family protein [Peptococcaceae bacterium]